MRKYPSSLDVSQGACSILRLVLRQKTVIQKGIVSSNAQLVRILEVYPTYDVELFARKHRILVARILRVHHLFVRMNVPVVVVFVLHCCFVEDLRRADMVVATETAEKELMLRVRCL